MDYNVITNAYRSGSFTDRLYLFCEYRDLRDVFLEIERTDPACSDEPGRKRNWFPRFFSFLSIHV